MKLFETSWVIKGKSYLREFDTTENKSIMRATVHTSEYYTEDPLGKFKSILDNTVKLSRHSGSAYKNPNAHGPSSAEYVAIREEHFSKQTYNKNANVWYIDIETGAAGGFPDPNEASQPIVVMQILDKKSNEIYILSTKKSKYKNDYKYVYDVNFLDYESETEMIYGYFELFKKLDPLIIYGWHANGFDYPFIYNRMKNLNISTMLLSNYGKVKLGTRIDKTGKVINNLEAVGHIYFDMMDVYKKFVMSPRASYSLDNIGEIETGICKVDHHNYLTFDDFRLGNYVILGNESDEMKATKLFKVASILKENPDHPKSQQMTEYIHEKSYSEFIHYSVIDVVILKGIDDARSLTDLVISMSEMMGSKLSDILGTLKAWSCFLTNKSMQDKLVMPPKIDHDKPHIVGGFVRAPQIGKHKWVVSSDVTSMYPLLSMVAFNMSGETFIPKQRRSKELNDIIQKYFPDQNEDNLLKLNEDDWKKIIKVTKDNNVSLGINGAVFDNNKEGIIPKLIIDIYKSRKQKKKEMFEHEQNAIKLKDEITKNKIDMSSNHELVKQYETEIEKQKLCDVGQLTLKLAMNSLFGATGNRYFSLYNEDFAAAITGNGRFFIKLLANNIDEKLNSMIRSDKSYVVAGDTDSIYFSVAPFVEKYVKNESLQRQTDWVNAFYEKILEETVQKTIDEFATKLNAKQPDFIGADREAIANSALFVAKKKYAMSVVDMEHVRYPDNDLYLKVMGLEVAQGGVAPFAKENLKKAIPIILNKDTQEVKDWFQSVRKIFMDSHVADKAKTTGVTQIKNEKWGKVVDGRKVSIPFGSKACIATNKYIKANNLQEQFPLIDAGTKVKIMFLNQPNPLKAEAFAFTDPRFAEMFKDYIDYDTVFERYFVKPLKNMTDALGIDVTKNIESLDDEWEV